MKFYFKDPFGEKRGKFDYKSILRRLQELKGHLEEIEEKSSDLDESSDLDHDCESPNHSH